MTVRLSSGGGKTAELDGARLPSTEPLRREFPALAFTPDRLVVVKGGPAARRAYFDRVLARLDPPRGGLSQEYASTLAQRNAALRRVQLGLSPTAALSPWTTRLAVLAAGLAAARAATLALLAPAFEELRPTSVFPAARLGYTPAPPTAADLDARLDADIARGATGLGPHLDDIRILSGDRDLRSFGSQGEQRLALLALLLAEAELLPRRRSCCSTTCSPSSTAAAAACWRSGSRRRPGRDHDDAPLGLPGGGRSGGGGDPWTGSVTRSARELARFGPQAGLADLVARWPDAVGGGISRNAWPARIARDGTAVIHTSDSIWAFELGHRAAEIAGRLGVPAVKFLPGPLPEPAELPPASPSARADPGSGRRSGVDRGADRRPGAP